jgi:NADH-quinone oxidoreductase subunit G
MDVDGKKITWDGKKMILQACLDAGMEIPHYCYHQGLSIVASCRICLVEIESPDLKDPAKLVKVPKLVPSCQTPAVDGMKVHSASPKSIANQKAVMEFLLLNHPLDCPVCDQAGECHLQDYSYQYGRSESRFEEDKAKKPKKNIGKHVVLYSDRCIMCTRCVRFTREISGTGELAVFGRGHREEIDVFQGKSLDNPLSGNVIDICPVGALLDKDFLFTQRVWFLKKTPSISPFTSGGENISIEHNQGRVYRLKPRFNADVNKWWISDDIRYGWDFIHNNRLQTPMAKGVPQEMSAAQGIGQLDQAVKKSAASAPGSTMLVLNACDSTEEMFLAAQWIRRVDPQAWLVLAEPKVEGQDQVFKNPISGAVTYTIHAEKAPNRRGGEKVLAKLGGNACGLADVPGKIKAGHIRTALVLADPFGHGDPALQAALAGLETLLVLSTRPDGPAAQAALALPVCTWAEKSGVFENHAGRIQAFKQAIAPLDNTRATGGIFWDLMDLSGTYDAAAVRRMMSELGMAEYADVTIPEHHEKIELMQFTEL